MTTYTVDTGFQPFQKMLKRIRKKHQSIDKTLDTLTRLISVNPHQIGVRYATQDKAAGKQLKVFQDQGATLRKARVKIVNIGKSSGPRLLFLVNDSLAIVTFLAIYRHQDVGVDLPVSNLITLLDKFLSDG